MNPIEKAPAEPSDNQVVSVEDPHDPGTLLGSDVAPNADSIRAATGLEDPDTSVLTGCSQVVATGAPVHTEQRLCVTLKKNKVK